MKSIRISIAIFLLTFPLGFMNAYANVATKDAIIQYFKTEAPTEMCKRIFKIFDEPNAAEIKKKANLTQSSCLEKASASINRCVTQYQDQIPEKVDEKNMEAVQNLAKQIGECAGEDFMKEFN